LEQQAKVFGAQSHPPELGKQLLLLQPIGKFIPRGWSGRLFNDQTDMASVENSRPLFGIQRTLLFVSAESR
jgi:hypothetical protein